MKSTSNWYQLLFFILTIGFFIRCENKTSQQKQKESKPDWVWLFDGSSTDKWRSLKTQSFPDQGWLVKDKQLIVLGKTENAPGGKDIITKDQYSSFELELEIKLTEGANSGIKYFVVNTFPGSEGQYLGCEYQLIDNERHPDSKNGVNGNRKMASLYDLIPAPGTIEVNPPNQWNKVRIVVKGNQVEHWLNEKKLLEFDRKSDHFRELVSVSKYKKLKEFGEVPQGHLLLQGHSDEVAFRSIKIRAL